jgi:predicted  nucleic acid-binding Zn-ribbon protein
MTIQCPICNLIYKTSDEVVACPCKRCGWKGRWKQETAPEDETTKEIEHPALRGCH